MNPGSFEACFSGRDDDCDGSTCGIEGLLEPQDATWTLEGGGDLEAFGAAVAVGDIDGQPGQEWVVAAPLEASGGVPSGAVYVFASRRSGGLAQAQVSIPAASPGQLLGAALEVADLNGDLVQDLVIGAPGDGTGGSSAGAVYVLHGPLDGSTALDERRAIIGTQGDVFGAAVAAGGDVDADGLVDLWVGAPSTVSGGEARLVRRGTTGSVRVTGVTVFDGVGTSIARPVDVSGDGIDDLWVGAPGADGAEDELGAAFLFLGPLTGVTDVDLASARRGGESPGDAMGAVVAAPGDVDGDGLDDLVAASPAADDGAGRAYVYLGPLTGADAAHLAHAIIVGDAGDGLGDALGHGDVDGDGRADLAVGAPDGGEAFLFLSPAAGTYDPSSAVARVQGREGTGVTTLVDGDSWLVGSIHGTGAVHAWESQR